MRRQEREGKTPCSDLRVVHPSVRNWESSRSPESRRASPAAALLTPSTPTAYLPSAEQPISLMIMIDVNNPTLESVAVALAIWLALEVVFYWVLTHLIHPQLNNLRSPPASPLPPRECLSRVLGALDTIKDSGYSLEKFCAGWFKGAKLEDIKRENMKVGETRGSGACVCVCRRERGC